MSSPVTYFIKRTNGEQGPLAASQLNRLKQRGEIAADTPCRTAGESTFRRLDEVLPHLKDAQVDPAKRNKLQEDIREYEVRSLTKIGLGCSAFFWAPFGIGPVTGLTAVVSGGILLFKYRRPIGLFPILLGALGLYIRFARLAGH